jgi:hypothetical protein
MEGREEWKTLRTVDGVGEGSPVTVKPCFSRSLVVKTLLYCMGVKLGKVLSGVFGPAGGGE